MYVRDSHGFFDSDASAAALPSRCEEISACRYFIEEVVI